MDSEEEQQAQLIGPDWADGLQNIQDRAKVLLPAPMDLAAKAANLDADDVLSKGSTDVINSVIPKSNEAEATLGSAAQDVGVEFAGDKVADTLTDEKDKLACSGAGSEVESTGCMVLMTPSNLIRGAYGYGKLLVERYGKMMDAVNAEFFPGQPE
jgi:hypothetical protein